MNRHRVGVLVAIWALGLATIAAALPGIPAGTALAQGIGQASYNGVTFNYDKALANNVSGQSVPSTVGQDVIFSEIRPEHNSFSFDGYPSKGTWSPQIRVIPMDAYKAAQPGVGSELEALEMYLGGDTDKPLPLLPAVNEARIITEGVAPVVGAGVSGVRFLASYAQGITPVGADNVTYMFTGITRDGKYYVEGTFPVALSTPLDSPPSTITPESVQAYNRVVAQRLRDTDRSGFTPTLDLLDKMVASIQVNATVIPGMPTTGADGLQNEGAIFILLGLAAVMIAAGRWISGRNKTPSTRT